MGDLDGDRLDDVVFADNESGRLRVLFQQPDGTFVEAPESGRARARFARPDACGWPTSTATDAWTSCLAKPSARPTPTNPGGWEVYLNQP